MRKSADAYSGISEPDALPELRALRMACGGLAAQALHAFASLGIPDHLRAGPLTASDLAAKTKSNAALLSRLLRFLSTIDVVAHDDSATFRLTRLGRVLCGQPRPAIRDAALLMNCSFYWSAIGGLLQQIRTGENAFQRAMGQDLFSYLAEHGEAERYFSAAMDSSTELGVADVLSLYDFSQCRHIVDVGGGKGTLLRAVLRKHPAVMGTSYDSEAVLRRAPEDSAIGPRLARRAGNFFDSVPAGRDTYVLRRVLHDWNDDSALRILQNCRAAMDCSSRLLIIELSPEHSANDWAGMDLLMMVLQDGKERTEDELRHLLHLAAFETVRTLRGDCPYWILEAKPA